MFNQYQPPYQTFQPPPYVPQYQQQQVRGVSGRVVSSVSEINVNDVPSDGTVGFFPASDGSCIWAKQWRSDGLIDTVRYVPEAAKPVENQPDRIDAIIERLDGIEAALKPKRKKGGGDDE